MQAHYDAIAKWYDVAGRFTTAHRADALRRLDAHAGDRVLDLACGTGINFESFAAANVSGLLLGLDYSMRLLEQAQARLKRLRLADVELCLGDAAQLPFADGTFNRVFCTYALKAIPDYRQVLDEVRRVLKPAGIFVAMDAQLDDGVTRFLNPLIRWMAHGFLHEIDRPLLSEIARRFQDVQITAHDFGHTCVIVARKE